MPFIKDRIPRDQAIMAIRNAPSQDAHTISEKLGYDAYDLTCSQKGCGNVIRHYLVPSKTDPKIDYRWTACIRCGAVGSWVCVDSAKQKTQEQRLAEIEVQIDELIAERTALGKPCKVVEGETEAVIEARPQAEIKPIEEPKIEETPFVEEKTIITKPNANKTRRKGRKV